MLKAVFFDIDDTLYGQIKPFKEAFYLVFPKIKIESFDFFYTVFRKFSDQIFPEYQLKKVTLKDMYIYRLSKSFDFFNLKGYSNKKILLFQKEYNKKLNNIVPFPEIEKLITILAKKKYKLGIISNGDFNHQINKVKNLGLLTYFLEQDIFISKDIGIAKPDSKIFTLVAQKEKLLPSEFLYIGDNFLNDIIGSSNAGMHTVWFNLKHQKRKEGDDVSPDLEINKCDEISKIYDLLERKV